MDIAIERRWSELAPLYDTAITLDVAERGAFVAGIADAELRAALAQMLASTEQTGPLDKGGGYYTQALLDADPAWQGQRLGAYRILEPIGRGGMATVFLAERAAGDYEQKLAIKILRHGLYEGHERALFVRERQIIAKLAHPHIARLIDGGLTAEGVPWFALEYVDGTAITRWCDGERLGVDGRLALFVDVCAAVEYAHQNLIVHRDLKPSNILVTADRQVKLLDFGIAKLLADESETADATRTGQRRLTPGYAAPEQWSGGTITIATDVYALGVLLHELLTGRKPVARTDGLPRVPSAMFAAGEAGADARASVRAGTPRALLRRLCGDLDGIVLKALHADPARRYASAVALREDIQRHLAGDPIRARPDAWSYRAGKFVQRHRWGMAAITALLLVLIGAAGFSAWQARIARREAARATAVKDFLFDLFASSHPQTKVHIKDVDELLARGAELAAQSFDSAPGLAGETLYVIGRTQDTREQYDAARTTLEKALPLIVRDEGEQGNTALAARTMLGRIDFGKGAYVQGESTMRGALAAYRAAPNPDPERLAAALYVLGQNQVRLRHMDDALASMQEAHSLLRGREAVQKDLPLAILNGLRAAYALTGRNAEALAVSDELMAKAESLFGADSRVVAVALTGKTWPLMNLGRFVEAEAALRRALAIREKIDPDGSQDAAIVRNDLGSLLTLQQRYAEARTFLLAALTNKSWGENHPERLNTLGNLAALQVQTGEFAVARTTLTQILGQTQTALGKDAAAVAKIERYLGDLDYWQGDFAAAQIRYEHALEIDRGKSGEASQGAATDRVGLARVALARGDAVAARSLAQTAVDTLARQFPAIHPTSLNATAVLAEAALGGHDIAAARSGFEAVSANAGAALPPQHVLWARALLGLADIDAANADAAAAKAHRDAALAELDASPSPQAVEPQRLRERWGQPAASAH